MGLLTMTTVLPYTGSDEMDAEEESTLLCFTECHAHWDSAHRLRQIQMSAGSCLPVCWVWGLTALSVDRSGSHISISRLAQLTSHCSRNQYQTGRTWCQLGWPGCLHEGSHLFHTTACCCPREATHLYFGTPFMALNSSKSVPHTSGSSSFRNHSLGCTGCLDFITINSNESLDTQCTCQIPSTDIKCHRKLNPALWHFMLQACHNCIFLIFHYPWADWFVKRLLYRWRHIEAATIWRKLWCNSLILWFWLRRSWDYTSLGPKLYVFSLFYPRKQSPYKTEDDREHGSETVKVGLVSVKLVVIGRETGASHPSMDI